MNYSNILQIDDDVVDCELFKEALAEVSSANYCAIHNPVEALKKLDKKELNPDAIFLDLNMPSISGIEFLATIKKEPGLKEIPVIIFSTSHYEDILLEAKSLGAKDFIPKPSDFNKLKQILNRFVVAKNSVSV